MRALLAIDTCTEVCSVSLYSAGVKINRLLKDVAKSSSLILPLCDEVFAEANIGVAELDCIIYTKGPGAFTGVRMCVAVVQGMAFAHNIPTLGFSTLEVLGFGAAKKYHGKPIAVALDARMGEVYWGVYQQQKLSNESLRKPNTLDLLGQDFIGVGSGWGPYQGELCQQTGVDYYQADFYPEAQNLIDLYLNHIQQQGDFDNKLALPTYLRNNVAQKSLK